MDEVCMLDDADRRATAVMEEQDAYSAEHRGGMPITMGRRLALHKYIADEFREALPLDLGTLHYRDIRFAQAATRDSGGRPARVA